MYHHFLYNAVFIPLMRLLTPLLGLFLPKLKKRELSWELVLSQCMFQKSPGKRLIWFHSASMGEFEQAKPIIERLKKQRDDIQILCTFFSPSGYDNQKNYRFADAVVYLPPDTLKNVRMFLTRFQPDIVVFIRYDIWHNFLREIHKLELPLFLVAATEPRIQFPLEFVKQFYSMNYSYFDTIFTVGKNHTSAFQRLDVNSELITLTDPRFDRITEVVALSKQNPLLAPSLFTEQFVLVAGSIWEPDENILIPALEKLNASSFKYQCIFVPHEPTKEHISSLQAKLKSVLLSDLLSESAGPIENSEKVRNKHIIVDSIGKLLGLYALADAAYVGGGFTAGIHSITEPAGYSIPLACGPKIRNSSDALILKDLSALEILREKEQVISWLENLSTQNNKVRIGNIAGGYINSNSGTSSVIVDYILQRL